MKHRPCSQEPTRRDIIKWAATSVAVTQVAWAQSTQPTGPTLRDKAKKNFTLGVFTSVYGQHLPLEEAARRIHEDGFKGVVFDYFFKDVRFDALAPDWDLLKRIVDTLAKNDLRILGLYGYYNVIDPNLERRKQGEARMELLIRNWKRFGTPIISLETGTYNKDSEFADDPNNWGEEAYQAVKPVFERWTKLAEEHGAFIAPEIYVRNIVGSIDRATRLLHDVNSPALKITMDPCNYYRNEELPKMKPMLEEMFKRFGPHIILAHAKDVKEAPDWPALPASGTGQLDYPLFLRLLAQLDRPLPLIIEHLTMDDVPRARDFVLKHIDNLG